MQQFPPVGISKLFNSLLLIILIYYFSITECASSVNNQILNGSPLSVSPNVILHSKSGLIKGFRQTDLTRDVNTFYGIPFAKPPIGELRFKRPEKIPPWGEKTIDATKKPNSCVQTEDTSFERIPGRYNN